MFPAYLRLRRIHPEVPRSFRIPGRVLPILLPVLGWCSILFAVMLLFIPPAGLDLGGYGLYVAKIVGGALLALLTAQWTYRQAMKRRAALKKN